jgi:LPS O-antigen subunit length determinant protein (WzzB/FepE family)
MLQNTPSPFPDIFDLLFRWWKKILLVVLVALVCVTVIFFIKPKQYLAVATALPASSYAADKSAVFNENIEALYPGLGSADELDKILGTAQLDTIYKTLVDSFNLVNDYSTTGNARQNAVEKLRKNSRVIKSDYGELKVKVWYTNPQKAAAIANKMMELLQQIHQRIQNENNVVLLEKLKTAHDKKLSESFAIEQKMPAFKIRTGVEIDSIKNPPWNKMHQAELLHLAVLNEQIQQYAKLIGEYELIVNANPKVLLIVENAAVPSRPDRPHLLTWLLITAFAGFVFAVLTALVLERKRVAIH